MVGRPFVVVHRINFSAEHLMSTRGPQGATAAAATTNGMRAFRMAPLARAIAMILAANGALVDAHAQQAFSGGWFAAKNATQSTATATGRLPNGMPASMLTNPLEQRKAGEQLQRSINNLNMAARGIAAQQSAQEAARLAALNGGSDIPDGLADGGLKVDSNSLTAGWLNAAAPVQTAAGGRTVVGIRQTDDKAILNWESFNVGKNTTVQFDQKGGAKPDGTNAWIALNRINDPSGRPSQIAGQIKADGSVYLVNRNGIVFTGSSQVNTRALVASSLALSDKQFKLGINNPQVLVNQGNDFPIPQFGEFTSERPLIYGDSGFKAGVGGAPDKMGGVDRFDPGAAPGEVRVDAGAQLAVDSGGKVMLFAPKVRNAGRISAPDGQVILAAGENIYLKTPSTQDPNAPRGLDVAASAVPGWAFTGGQVWGALKISPVYADVNFVGSLRDVVMPEMAARAKSVGYEVVNTGTVQADRGNITLQAQDVRQSGVLSATTALNNRNGSILLRAWGLGSHMYADGVNDLINWSAGTLTLGEGSISQVLPDASDTSEIEASALATRYQPGRVSLYGQLIDIRSKAGVLVPAGTIKLESAVNPMFTLFPYFKPGSLRDASRIYVDNEAFLSVAGLQGMQVAMSRNFIEAELRINELRDSPMQLDAWVRGKKVIVDRRVSGVFKDGPMAGVQWVTGPDGATYIPGAWVGTPLGDVSGWVGVGKTDLGELSANAGSIEMRAGGSVITRAGSMLDVSGGSVRYTDGMNTATKLMGADGRVHTMDRAMSDTDYTGMAGEFTHQHARWGVKTTWRTPLIGADYKEAGYTEGRKAGAVQVFAGDAMVLEGDMLGGVVVGERQSKKPGASKGGRLELGENTPDGRPWSPGTIVVSHDPKRLAQDFDARARLGEDFYVQVKPDELKSRKLTFLSDDMLSDSGMGTIVLNTINGDFELAKGAVLNLSPGASLSVAGTEGSTRDIRIQGQIRAPGGKIGLSSVNGKLEIGEQGRLDASGQWINTWRDGALRGAWALDGGAITVIAGKIVVHKDAALDVSGGGRVDPGKQGLPTLRVGNAGSISLAGVTPDLDLDALNMRAHAAGSAGSLSIQTASAVQVGGVPAAPPPDDAGGRPRPAVVMLPPTLFGERGFGNVTVSVRGEGKGIVVPEGVSVSQQATSLELNNFAWRDLPSGRSLAGAAPLGMLRPDERAARNPAALSLGTENGPVRIARGASVRTDTGGSLSLNAGGELGVLTVAGRLDAPAGRMGPERRHGRPRSRRRTAGARRAADPHRQRQRPPRGRGARRRYGEHPGGRHAAGERCAHRRVRRHRHDRRRARRRPLGHARAPARAGAPAGQQRRPDRDHGQGPRRKHDAGQGGRAQRRRRAHPPEHDRDIGPGRLAAGAAPTRAAGPGLPGLGGGRRVRRLAAGRGLRLGARPAQLWLRDRWADDPVVGLAREAGGREGAGGVRPAGPARRERCARCGAVRPDAAGAGPVPRRALFKRPVARPAGQARPDVHADAASAGVQGRRLRRPLAGECHARRDSPGQREPRAGPLDPAAGADRRARGLVVVAARAAHRAVGHTGRLGGAGACAVGITWCAWCARCSRGGAAHRGRLADRHLRIGRAGPVPGRHGAHHRLRPHGARSRRDPHGRRAAHADQRRDQAASQPRRRREPGAERRAGVPGERDDRRDPRGRLDHRRAPGRCRRRTAVGRRQPAPGGTGDRAERRAARTLRADRAERRRAPVAGRGQPHLGVGRRADGAFRHALQQRALARPVEGGRPRQSVQWLAGRAARKAHHHEVARRGAGARRGGGHRGRRGPACLRVRAGPGRLARHAEHAGHVRDPAGQAGAAPAGGPAAASASGSPAAPVWRPAGTRCCPRATRCCPAPSRCRQRARHGAAHSCPPPARRTAAWSCRARPATATAATRTRRLRPGA
jgi:filamentous hemagglutinin family protein